MGIGWVKYLFVFAVLCLASQAIGADTIMEPAPADRVRYLNRVSVGQVRYNKYGMRDVTPDVISLEYLPKDVYGFVDWAQSMREGIIAPRDSLKKRRRSKPALNAPPLFSKEILRRVTKDFMPDVIFPHTPHNVWLKCNVCHPKIFKMQAGATPITMTGIWRGKFCGRCHDKVAFPTRNCFKCHSASKVYKRTWDQRTSGRY
jgi:c(7)-type cytochrome triheme protein